MLKKALITGMILVSILVSTMNIAVAQYSETFSDDKDDVFDSINQVNVTNKPHIDIREFTCSRDYRKVTIRLTLEDSVANKGDIRFFDENYLEELLEKLESGEITEAEIQSLLYQTMVYYSFSIITSENEYLVFYVNEEVLIYSLEDELESTLLTVNDNVLTVTFNLLSSRENLTMVEILTNDGGIDPDLTETNYFDEFYVFCDDPLEATEDNGGDDDDDNGSPGFELITLLVAIVIGVLLLRKKRT